MAERGGYVRKTTDGEKHAANIPSSLSKTADLGNRICGAASESQADGGSYRETKRLTKDTLECWSLKKRQSATTEASPESEPTDREVLDVRQWINSRPKLGCSHVYPSRLEINVERWTGPPKTPSEGKDSESEFDFQVASRISEADEKGTKKNQNFRLRNGDNNDKHWNWVVPADSARRPRPRPRREPERPDSTAHTGGWMWRLCEPDGRREGIALALGERIQPQLIQPQHEVECYSVSLSSARQYTGHDNLRGSCCGGQKEASNLFTEERVRDTRAVSYTRVKKKTWSEDTSTERFEEGSSDGIYQPERLTGTVSEATGKDACYSPAAKVDRSDRESETASAQTRGNSMNENAGKRIRCFMSGEGGGDKIRGECTCKLIRICLASGLPLHHRAGITKLHTFRLQRDTLATELRGNTRTSSPQQVVNADAAASRTWIQVHRCKACRQTSDLGRKRISEESGVRDGLNYRLRANGSTLVQPYLRRSQRESERRIEFWRNESAQTRCNV
ncbi:hypothetical protein C8R47DRAFT_1083201 [Mycena vitilis]|nr:hypothetical protein C8R47DRAFT_1083201 [Mycena vitilis]